MARIASLLLAFALALALLAPAVSVDTRNGAAKGARMRFLIFTEECYEAFLTEFNFIGFLTDLECLKSTISKPRLRCRVAAVCSCLPAAFMLPAGESESAHYY